jgi:hypothetical protein
MPRQILMIVANPAVSTTVDGPVEMFFRDALTPPLAFKAVARGIESLVSLADAKTAQFAIYGAGKIFVPIAIFVWGQVAEKPRRTRSRLMLNQLKKAAFLDDPVDRNVTHRLGVLLSPWSIAICMRR